MSDNNFNPVCNNDEQIVSFLYGEMTGKEKSNFELHLQSCTKCAEELGDFSTIRFSIQDWRAESFQNLSTPIFEMPKKTSRFDFTNSWIESIRCFFSLHSVGFSAAAVAVVLAFFGFFCLYNISDVNKEIAANQTEKSSNNPSVKSEQALVDKNNETSDKNESATEGFSVGSKKVNESLVQPEVVSVKNTVSRNLNSVKSKKINSEVTTVKSNKNIEKIAPKKQKIENLPTLAVEENEDKSLRLSDIFDEVSLK